MRKRNPPSDTEKSVGQVLKTMREAAGLTATAVAYRLGMSESNYFRYESGENQLNVLQIGDFAWALEVAPRTLFERIQPLLHAQSQVPVPEAYPKELPADVLVEHHHRREFAIAAMR